MLELNKHEITLVSGGYYYVTDWRMEQANVAGGFFAVLGGVVGAVICAGETVTNPANVLGGAIIGAAVGYIVGFTAALNEPTYYGYGYYDYGYPYYYY